jgi:hypothetical protein
MNRDVFLTLGYNFASGFMGVGFRSDDDRIDM